MRSLGGGDDLGVAGAEFAERDIFADGAAEQMDDLPDIGDLLAQRAARHRGNILAVDQDLAGVDVVEPQQQIEHCRFAAARRTDQRGDLAALGNEAHAAQHRRFRAIGESDVVEFDPRVVSLSAGRSSSFGSPAGLSMTS